MSRHLRRWVIPAALSAACGVALALWGHDDRVGEIDAASSAVSAAPAPADPSARAGDEPSSTSTATSPASASPAEAADADTSSQLQQLQQLQVTLNRHLDGDPLEALAMLVTLNDVQRSYLAEDVVREAAARAPEATLRWIDQHFPGGADRQTLLIAAYAGVAATDPMFAMNGVQGLDDPELRQHGVHQVLEAWSQHDPVTAYEWVRSQTGNGSADLFVTVMAGYMKKLPHQAGELIAGMPDGRTRARLMDQYAFELAESDPTEAAEWLSQFEPGQVAAQNALASVYDRWAQQDPWAAMEHAMLTVEGELAFELVGNVAVEMGLSRPNELAGSLDRIPEPYRGLAAHRLAAAWGARAPDQARRWVDGLPDGELQQQARRGLSASRGG